MELKVNIIACTCLCFFEYSDAYNCAEIKNDVKASRPTNTAINNRTIPAKVDGENDSNTLIPLMNFSQAFEIKTNIEAAGSEYISKSMDPIPGLVVPVELSSRIKSPDELVALLNSPKLLAALSVPEILSVVTVLTSTPGLLTAVPPSAVVNVISALSADSQLFARLPRPILYSLLTVFTVRPRLFDSLPTTIAAQFAQGLFSLSPGTLYDVPTPILVNFMGAVCSPAVLGALSPSQLVNFVTLLSLSASLVKGLPVTGFVSLLVFLSIGVGADALRHLPPSTLFGLLRGLFDTMSDSSPYLLNVSTVPAIVAFLHSLLTPSLLNVLPLDVFRSLLTVLWSSPSLLTALDVTDVTSLLSAIASSPKLLVSVDTGHLAGLLDAIVSSPALLNAIPQHVVVALMNAIVAYLPKFLYSIPKSTLSALINLPRAL